MANSMEPIKDINIIEDIADFLRADSPKHGERNRVMWLMGIYFGLRISKLLELKVRDVRNKDIVYLRGNKRNKERKLTINDELKEIINEYIKDKKDYEYLFPSQKDPNKPVGRGQCWRKFSQAGAAFNIEKVGTHTLRKTYGYIIYIESGKDAVAVKEALNLSSVDTALRYIGIIRDQSNQIMSNMRLLSK